MALLRVTVGKLPQALAVDSSTGKVYVANNTDGTVDVLDPSNNYAVNPLQWELTPAVCARFFWKGVCSKHRHSGTVTVIDPK